MIRCPHCGYEMTVKGLHGGAFTPRCPKCGKKFTITMGNESAEPVVQIDAEVAGVTAAPPGAGRGSSPGRAAPPEEPRPGTGGESRARKTSPEQAPIREMPKVYQRSAGRNRARGEEAGLRTGKLGGYELKRRLGQSGMGTVYLARQVSQDRDVAVKVLSGELAGDAQFVSRFVREAYAAAHLVHPNVVQIHDIGQERRVHYYSMEFVRGQSLADLIRSEGAIDPDRAAGYILQAARGLKVAHEQGMIHRDIKPENLLLSQDGIVKVADLGLVSRIGEKASEEAGAVSEAGAEAGAGQARMNMGARAYMAPEQTEDAANVDARADIYSLGCTLYALLTGHAPFEGKSAQEVMERALQEPVPSPKVIRPEVPSELARITRMMTARKREERYANAGQMIRDLERYLGVEGQGAFTPRQEHVKELETCVRSFNESSMATLRRVLIGVFIVGLALGAGMMGWRGEWSWAMGAIAILGATSVFYQAILSFTEHGHMARRMRQMVFHASWGQWAGWWACVLLGMVAIFAMGWVGAALLIGAVGVILAAGFHWSMDLLLARQRRHAISRAEDLFKGLRLKGLDEDALQKFACEYAGRHWEEFFEAMFGYEAKLEARKRWGKSARGHNRPTHAAWRDPIIRWIDEQEEALRQEKEKRHLLRVETEALEAQGIEEVAAAKQARRMAEMMMAQARQIRDRVLRSREVPETPVPAEQQPKVHRAREPFRFDAEEERTEYRPASDVGRLPGGVMEQLFGTRTRFVLAAILLGGFLIWRYEDRGAEPLRLPLVPDAICDVLGSWNAGVAGLILLIGAAVRRLHVGIAVLAGAAMALWGEHLPIVAGKTLGNPATVAMLMGIAIAGIGLIGIGRRD